MNAAKSDAQDLLDILLPFAKQMLQQHQEFFPFGGRMVPDGTIAYVGATDGTEHPSSQPLIQLMQGAFREEACTAALRTCGILYDVRIIPPGHTEKKDAIAAAFDHVSGYSVVVFFPYYFDESAQLQVDSPFASEGEYSIFGRPKAAKP
ncbi:MAG TPA: hypothetical protein VK961_08725 [Chthoniobacter sp.]|nr:hypothetical protein [Chthoniobacter sp.]